MTPPRECRARVLAVRAPAADVLEADLRMHEPESLTFEAGQWVSVPFGPKIVRAYSIASPPHSPRVITLCADVAPGGIGSAWFRALAPGAEVVFKGPLGGFVFARTDPRRPLFVAEEIGIVPVRSILTHLYATGFGRSATLVYGAGPARIYDREMRSLARRYPGFSYHPVPAADLASAVESLVNEDRGAPRLRRGAAERQGGLGGPFEAARGMIAYVAGGEASIRRVREVLMAKGLERRSVKWEKFW
jgi:ferredoxin-NADP reductase